MKYLLLLFTTLFITQSSFADDFKMLSANRIAGLIPEIEDAYGVTFRDLNNDQYPDLYIVCFRGLNRLLINNGGIIPFVGRTISSGLGGYLMRRGKTNLELGSNTADFNNDGLPDIFIAGWGKTHSLFKNLGALKFENKTADLNVLGLADINQALWFDADNDGNLDIFLTDEHYSNRLLINQGDETFKETVWTDVIFNSLTSQGACAGDFDNDGDMDIYVANWGHPDNLLYNNGSGFFTASEDDLPTLKNDYISNSVSCADVDNDGDLDLFVATRDGYIFSYRNDSGSFKMMNNMPFAKPQDSVYGLLFEDFNQDGWLDCLITTRGINRLYLNDGRGGFENSFDSDSSTAYSTGSAAADLDLDGDLDVFISNKNADCQLFLNPSNKKNYLILKFIGIKSNRDAVGTKVSLFTGDDDNKKLIAYREVKVNRSYLSSGPAELFFAVNDFSNLQMEAVFPSGKKVIRDNFEPGKRYVIKEYSEVVSALYLSQKFVLFHIKQSSFWLNAVLLLLLFGWLYVYTYFGVRRYSWHAFQMATLLIIWLFGAISLIFILRDRSFFIILVSLLGFSIPGSLLLTVYFEFQKKQRERQSAFNDGLREFSEEMMRIYNNDDLYKRFLQVLYKHPHISKTMILFQDGRKLETAFCIPDQYKNMEYELNYEQEQLLSEKALFLPRKNKKLASLFEAFKLNVLMPIRGNQAQSGYLGLYLENGNESINKEDLHNIATITNQLLIAVDNNDYIKKEAELVKELTESRIRKEYLKQLEKTNKELDRKNSELTRLFKELQQKESQLIHSEKMASLGQLVAGISHELNNPISFIYANMQILERYIKEIEELTAGDSTTSGEFSEILNDIKSIIEDNKRGSLSVKEIVQNLKSFSRLDQAEWKKAFPVDGIENSLKILKPQISDKITIKKELKFNPEIYCNPGQLNQVFVNIIMNAFQALEQGGTLEIKSYKENDKLMITFADDGPGIDAKIISKIFDPFFTTKDVNKGTGLGLSISYNIIQSHGGRLSVESTPAKGTTFIIELPLDFSGPDAVKEMPF
jgi:signal transduction histidine kinase